MDELTCNLSTQDGEVYLLARASAYAGRSCCQDGSSPAERPVVVTLSPQPQNVNHQRPRLLRSTSAEMQLSL
jgi:hypothetical protein